jgi:hypothetical protein
LDDREARVVHGPRRDRPGARLFLLTTSQTGARSPTGYRATRRGALRRTSLSNCPEVSLQCALSDVMGQ